jgi:hypothetical protein
MRTCSLVVIICAAAFVFASQARAQPACEFTTIAGETKARNTRAVAGEYTVTAPWCARSLEPSCLIEPRLQF